MLRDQYPALARYTYLNTATYAALSLRSRAAMVAHLGLVTVTVAYLLYAAGLRTVPLGASATLSLAEPATATVLATLVLGEHLGPVQWAGLGLVGTGLALLAIGDA